MYCKSCGSYMEDTFNVCQNCGTKKGLGSAFCDKCGSVRQVGMAFCQNCGNAFDTQQSVEQSAAPYAQQTTAQQYQSVAQMDTSKYLPAKKFCRNCGAQVMNNQVICTKCGVKVGQGTSYCPHCAAPVQPGAVACMSCGQSIKTFDIADYFNTFYENFASIFRTKDILSLLLDNGAYFISVLMFILSFIPSIEAVASAWGVSTSNGTNIYGNNGFCGFLLILAFVTAIARFEPNINKFVNTNQQLGKYYVFVTPGLMLISLIITVIDVITSGAVASIYSYGTSSYGVSVAVYFNFWGWIMIIFTLAAAVCAVLSFLRKQNILKF